MQCMHCFVAINVEVKDYNLSNDADGRWSISEYQCPSCGRSNLTLIKSRFDVGSGLYFPSGETVVRPQVGIRPPAPDEVPSDLRELYNEASSIAILSPRASGALIRRALQQVIRQQGKIERKTLMQEIDDLIGEGSLPSSIAELLHAIRVVGNFAAHPTKDINTGEVIDVEPCEVELVFDIMDALFDFYFIQPSITAQRKEKLNQKLRDAGKPEI